MNATRPSPKKPTISLSTRKHTLFDADVATINTSQVESFLFNKSLRPNGSPTEKNIIKKMSSRGITW